jgi:cytochrome P450
MAVLAETLRLWPPSYMVIRRILESVILDRRTMQVETMCPV